MMRWTNGLPSATTRLGAKMALRGLAASQPGCARIPMMVRSKRCSTKRPDTLMQLSRSSLSESRLAPHGRAIHFGTLDRRKRNIDGVKRLCVNVVRGLVVGLAHQRDESLRGREVRGRRRTEVRGINHAVGRLLGQIEKRWCCNAIGAEPRQLPAHLLDLAVDERALGVTRPFHDRIGIGRANSGQLSDEIEIATRISLVRGDAHAELLARFGESVETALAEVVVDVKEPETLQVRRRRRACGPAPPRS